MKWGYQLPGTLVINAKAETAPEKPLFRRSLAAHRCLIPATAFYEWDAGKRKYQFTLPEEPVLYMAGLFDRRGGEDCYCILTTAANDSMKPVHDRMPLILFRGEARQWLSDELRKAELLLAVTPPPLAVRSAEQQLSLW